MKVISFSSISTCFLTANSGRLSTYIYKSFFELIKFPFSLKPVFYLFYTLILLPYFGCVIIYFDKHVHRIKVLSYKFKYSGIFIILSTFKSFPVTKFPLCNPKVFDFHHFHGFSIPHNTFLQDEKSLFPQSFQALKVPFSSPLSIHCHRYMLHKACYDDFHFTKFTSVTSPFLSPHSRLHLPAVWFILSIGPKSL